MRKRRNAIEKEPQTRPSSCVGCGKAATGYNYGAPSCSSCRAFFRRTVLIKYASQECTKFGECLRDESIPVCRACRYQKCVTGGMNVLLVTSKEQSDINQNISNASVQGPDVEEDIKKGAHSAGELQHENIDRTTGHELQIAQNPLCIEIQADTMMRNLISLNEAHQRLRISAYTPKLVAGLSIDFFLPGPSKLGIYFGPMSLQSYKPFAIRLMPMEIAISRRIVTDFTNFDYSSKKLWQFQDVAYTIEFIKALPVYNKLDDSSKRVLLGSALTCANYTTAFYSYTHKSDRSCYPDGSVMTWNSEMHRQTPDSTRFYTGLIAAMKEARLDDCEYALLKVIIICNPLIEGLHPSDIILLQKEKELCTKTLFSYVLAKRGAAKGPEFFAKILSIADVTMRLTNWLKSQGILVLALDLFKNRSPFVETMYHSR